MLEQAKHKLNSTVAFGENLIRPFIIMVSLFFLFGFVTVMNNVLMPYVKELFNLTILQASLVQWAFYIAYLVCGFPAGWVISKIGYKRGIMLALGITGIGLIMFILTPIVGTFAMVLASLFVLGSGITIAQVAANPYTVALGSPDTGASRLTLANVFNSFATMVMPIIGGSMLFTVANSSLEDKFDAMRGPYFVLAAVVLIFAAIIGISKLPEIKYDTVQEIGGKNLKGMWQYKHLILGAGAIFCYVGAEVSVANMLTDFLAQPKMGAFTKEEANWFISVYWGSAFVGRFLGFILLQKVKAERALVFVSIMAVYFIFVGMFTSGIVSRVSIVVIGLCNSIMWPCIISSSLAGLGKYTSQGSGLLITMVFGGAIIPLIQAYLAENWIGVNLSYGVDLLCYIFILYFALVGPKWAREDALISNA